MFQILKISSAYFEVKYFLGKGNKQYSQISQFRPKVKTRTKNYLSCASCGFFHFGSRKRVGPLFHKNVCVRGRGEERGRGERGKEGEEEGERRKGRERGERYFAEVTYCLSLDITFLFCKVQGLD